MTEISIVHISNRLYEFFGNEPDLVLIFKVKIQECRLFEELHDEVGAMLLLVEAVGVVLDDGWVVHLFHKLKVLFDL